MKKLYVLVGIIFVCVSAIIAGACVGAGYVVNKSTINNQFQEIYDALVSSSEETKEWSDLVIKGFNWKENHGDFTSNPSGGIANFAVEFDVDSDELDEILSELTETTEKNEDGQDVVIAGTTAEKYAFLTNSVNLYTVIAVFGDSALVNYNLNQVLYLLNASPTTDTRYNSLIAFYANVADQTDFLTKPTLYTLSAIEAKLDAYETANNTWTETLKSTYTK